MWPDAVRNGEGQVLGRYDMAEQNPYVSRSQCFVHVEADGTASLVSTGKAPTAMRAPGGAWYGIKRDYSHALKDGEQIALDSKSPGTTGSFSAVYTAYVRQDGGPQPSGYQYYE